MRKATIIKKFNHILDKVNHNRSKLGLDSLRNIQKIDDEPNKFITIYAVSSERKRKEEAKRQANNS